MKNIIQRTLTTTFAAFILTGCATDNGASRTPTAQSTSASAVSDNGWEKVVVTRNADDVKNLTRVDDVSASAYMVFGTPSNLRKTATDKIKKAAVKLGATIVLIQRDEFQSTPINNVNLIGVAYK